jgi:hypothetical protein
VIQYRSLPFVGNFEVAFASIMGSLFYVFAQIGELKTNNASLLRDREQ